MLTNVYRQASRPARSFLTDLQFRIRRPSRYPWVTSRRYPHQRTPGRQWEARPDVGTYITVPPIPGDMILPYFYFEHASRRRWTKQQEGICRWFEILFPAAYGRFRDYLQSPYLVDQSLQLDALFHYIHTYAYTPHADKLEISGLLDRFFGSTDYDRYRKPLKTRVDKLLDHLADFAAHEALRERPVEKMRLLCESISPEANRAFYAEHIRAYQSMAENLPAGINGAFHRWRALHLAPGRSEGTVAGFTPGTYEQAHRRFDRLTEIVGALYRSEATQRQRILRGHASSHPPLSSGEEKDATLLRLYEDLDRLSRQTRRPVYHYLRFSRDLSTLSAELDREQQLNLYLSLRNHTAYLRRGGRPLPTGTVSRWPARLARRKVYRNFYPIAPTVALDEYVLLCMDGGGRDADLTLRELLRSIRPASRAWFNCEAQLIRQFYNGDFVRATETANHLMRHFPQVRDWRILLRRHSFRLRACMEVQLRANSVPHTQLSRTALRSFEQYLLHAMQDAPHRATFDFIRNFIRVSRHLVHLLDRRAARQKPTDRLRTIVLSYEGKIHASSWLLDFLSRV